MDTTESQARDLLDAGPVTVEGLSKAAGVTVRSAQRVLAEMYQDGRIERRKGTTADGRAGGWTYYRKRDEGKAQRSTEHRLTPKRRKALDALRSGKWRTTSELRALLGCSHSEPFRLVSDLEGMGLIRPAGEAKTTGGGRAPTIYEPVEVAA